mmetsp:Transcript_143701/g.264954  ORF Transcript_143701/g.264954 Transcript_143701/m.264954 type:complete len:240 (+) Transcript_143701:757-1476(+)
MEVVQTTQRLAHHFADVSLIHRRTLLQMREQIRSIQRFHYTAHPVWPGKKVKIVDNVFVWHLARHSQKGGIHATIFIKVIINLPPSQILLFHKLHYDPFARKFAGADRAISESASASFSVYFLLAIQICECFNIFIFILDVIHTCIKTHALASETLGPYLCNLAFLDRSPTTRGPAGARGVTQLGVQFCAHADENPFEIVLRQASHVRCCISLYAGFPAALKLHQVVIYEDDEVEAVGA